MTPGELIGLVPGLVLSKALFYGLTGFAYIHARLSLDVMRIARHEFLAVQHNLAEVNDVNAVAIFGHSDSTPVERAAPRNRD
jgi:hypothetical protein